MTPDAQGIQLQDLSLVYSSGKNQTYALKNLTLTINPGGITGLLGPDGAGKTTLLRILAGLLAPDAGSAKIFGKSPSDLKKDSPNSIGYMPQRFGLYEDLSVRDNLSFYAELRSIPPENRATLFARLLDFTNLQPFGDRLAGNLSGGMKQKLGIACALLGNPRILLLDEPGVGVDPRSRLELWQMVGELSDQGMIILWATSYLDEGARCATLIALEKGELLFGGAPEKIAHTATGTVYRLPAQHSGRARRSELAWWIQQPGIIDVSIEGNFIRVETGEPGQQAAERTVAKKGGVPVQPNFGDGYIRAIGGIDKRPSPFTTRAGSIAKTAGERIRAEGLSKKFGSFVAAHDITFRVMAGEIFGLLGPNGAGKSTTFRMLCGLLKPTSGSCSVDGIDLLHSGSAARGRLGYMAQKFSLYQDISVWQNIVISARLYGLSFKYIRDTAPAMAEALDLAPILKTRTGDLNPGEKQRLALLCATIHQPPVLFLDEPTSGVDLRTRRDFWKHISALANAGTAVLVTTHFMEEAEYCDQIALIYRGSMISQGSPADLRATVKDQPNPTMEDAFIASIVKYDQEHAI